MSSVEDLREVAPEPVTLDIKQQPEPKQPTLVSKCINYLLKLQKYSAYGLTGFLGLHISSVVIVPGLSIPWELCQEVFEMARNVYHGIPFFEPIGIFGCGIVHIGSGIGIRFLRGHQRKTTNHHEVIIKDEQRNDIGLGGITGLLGLGYKKSIILTIWPGMTPLSISGYVTGILLIVHIHKFRYVPLLIDGDLSLINLEYIGYVLQKSPLAGLGKWVNWTMLTLLVWTSSYHITSGWLRYMKKYSMRWKRLAYGIINGGFLLGVVALLRYRKVIVSNGFIGDAFNTYILKSWV